MHERRRIPRLTALLFAAACFTGDGLAGQPCRDDTDCNPIADVFGDRLRCDQNICGYEPRCGDLLVDPDLEECDDGAANVARTHGLGPGECSATTCRILPYCGDGVTQAPHESCDDGDGDDADECPHTCQTARCGDGFVGPGEACEPAPGEHCTAECALPTCGDGLVQGDEKCDDGNDDPHDECLDTCLIARCGDGVVREGTEECDDGNDDDDDTCVKYCKHFTCGDGVVGPGEACDDGNADDIACTSECAGPSCGDGVVQAPEQCDDSNDDDLDDCLSTCREAACGDAIVHPDLGEECDDGNQVTSDDCVMDCKSATCGDGNVQLMVEACDDGNDEYIDGCVADCELAACGDGLVYMGVEECDDKNVVGGDGCSSLCRHEHCGDGIQQPMEACDDGNKKDGDGCSAACAFEKCGDKNIQPPELCDDGNAVNTDDCVACKPAACGDGVTWEDHEDCDDGNDVKTDACVDCELPTCGDGHVWADHEACDDGPNNGDSKPCKADCTVNVCGDGEVGPDEECDDGNKSNLDPCLNDCTANGCGDGFVDATAEGCDDQNKADNDGCSNSCRQGATALGAGSSAHHVCALRQGQARCWGSNDMGQLWQGSTANLGDEPGELPEAIPDVPSMNPMTDVVEIVAGFSHTCARLASGVVRCWGYNGYGQLGFGASAANYGDEPNEVPPPVALGGTAVGLAAGLFHTCALMSGGGVRCWGINSKGVLGVPGAVSGQKPETLGDIALDGKAVALAAGGYHNCAVLAGGAVRCWGSNNRGQLGLGHTNTIGDDEAPTAADPVQLGAAAVELAAGESFTCAVTTGGSLRCWGWGDSGRLGYQNTQTIGDDEHPSTAGDVKMIKPGEIVADVAVGSRHTCALLVGGAVRCWGDNSFGQLGYGNTTSYGGGPTIPALVEVGPDEVLALALTTRSTCVLVEGGRVRCWGWGASGQLGINSTVSIGDETNEMPPLDASIYPNP